MSSAYSHQASTAGETTPAQPQNAGTNELQTDLLTAGGDLEVDDTYTDSGFGTDNTDTTSVASSIYAGFMENGRRYQTVREGEYWGPSDEKQFESMHACHIVHSILDSKQPNPLFFAPISKTAQNILDIGTGTGIWAIEVADKFPSAVVTGVDLYPPPETWVPPNCRLEVEDVLKVWSFPQKFDLIHLRYVFGSFDDEQWRLVYKQAYNNLLPGGWIEQIEPGITFRSDDGTLADDMLLKEWGPMFLRCAEQTGKKLDTEEKMKGRIEAAGFVNVHERMYKVPVGDWAKNPLLKEAGRFQKMQFLVGMEGYSLYFLTKYGEPHPWTPEEVQVYLAKVRKEASNGSIHYYLRMRRVWAQKPFDVKPRTSQPTATAENAA